MQYKKPSQEKTNGMKVNLIHIPLLKFCFSSKGKKTLEDLLVYIGDIKKQPLQFHSFTIIDKGKSRET
jgi:hypothetical protein